MRNTKKKCGMQICKIFRKNVADFCYLHTHLFNYVGSRLYKYLLEHLVSLMSALNHCWCLLDAPELDWKLKYVRVAGATSCL